MYVKEIKEVKDQLDLLKKDELVKDWELPYENLLTRLSAAIFFLDPSGDEQSSQAIWDALSGHDNFSYRLNEEKKLSSLKYRITFSKEEKEKNFKKELNETPQNA